MKEVEVKALPEKAVRAADHLANERTYLAWIRTGIAIMAFGFVVVKFSLFVKQIALVVDQSQIHVLPAKGYSALLGISLVALGTVMCLLAFFRYKTIERQLHENKFYPSMTLTLLFTICIFLTGLMLVLYLIPNL